jgi:ankyrin repeat protein
MIETQPCFQLLAAGDLNGLRRLIEQEPSAAASRDASGVSLLMQTLYRGHRDLAETIATNKELDIFEAASLGKLDRLKECCHDKSAAASHSADGFTALHFACYFGQAGSARVLIENGAAVDAVASNPMKVMPLHSAASARNLEAARVLLEHGAPVNARQEGGWSPIHAAAQNGDHAMVDLLLQHGADTKTTNDDGKTPASIAKEKGHTDLATMLENSSQFPVPSSHNRVQS